MTRTMRAKVHARRMSIDEMRRQIGRRSESYREAEEELKRREVRHG